MIQNPGKIRTEIIYDMPESEYYALPYLSATQLKIASRDGLAELRKYLDQESVGTKAQRMGWLCHMRVNSPQDWAKVAHPPQSLCEGIKTKDGKPSARPKTTAEYEKRLLEWELDNQDKIRVSEEEYLQTERITAALLESSCYQECSATEVVILFDFMGEQAKCRVDGELLLENGAYDLYDWKFVAGTRAFASKIFDYRYHMQGAFYLYAYDQVNRQPGKFYLVGIDKETCDPNYTTCAPLSQGSLELGLRECVYWHRQIQHARQTDHWPGVEPPDEWTIPGWYRSPLIDPAANVETDAAWTP